MPTTHQPPDIAAEVAAALPPMATIAETAEFLRVSRRTLTSWIAEGRIQTFKPNPSHTGRRLVPRSAVTAFLSGSRDAA